MFDGTYPNPPERRANNTEKRPHKHDDERNPIILPPSTFRWEDNPLPIPTTEELDANPLPMAKPYGD